MKGNPRRFMWEEGDVVVNKKVRIKRHRQKIRPTDIL